MLKKNLINIWIIFFLMASLILPRYFNKSMIYPLTSWKLFSSFKYTKKTYEIEIVSIDGKNLEFKLDLSRSWKKLGITTVKASVVSHFISDFGRTVNRSLNYHEYKLHFERVILKKFKNVEYQIVRKYTVSGREESREVLLKGIK